MSQKLKYMSDVPPHRYVVKFIGEVDDSGAEGQTSFISITFSRRQHNTHKEFRGLDFWVVSQKFSKFGYVTSHMPFITANRQRESTEDDSFSKFKHYFI